ncbi:GTPase-associated system all-helical protein GASH [Paraburkholderia adhaesiva]|uniref:GTPase-associated system all-helical protein GASH n=1 Tax=Paraburkholderia adhaesiva TaxID=2883244 RepID=UPI001F24BDF6|nr:GTPase-associated system all-helical protein GASH [Paraburkholderia adhaesiva]
MEAIKRMGVLYGKLGLATQAALIEARGQGVLAASESISAEHVPGLVSCALGLKGMEADEKFWTFFSEKDPTFDVAPQDKEAALLAASTIACCLEAKCNFADYLSLCLVTASFGGVRPAVADGELLSLAEHALAAAQSASNEVPKDRTYSKQPSALTDSLENLAQPAARQQPANGIQHAHAALAELATYAEASALAAARNDNAILAYLRKLESEMRVYWWVNSGWSIDTGKPFASFPPIEAAVLAAKELAEKSATTAGLFAAPALLAMVLEKGRPRKEKPLSIAEAATAPNRKWRQTHCAAVAQTAVASLVPITTALGLAAASDDASDWQPRFERVTGLSLATGITPEQVAIQVYRERLLLSALDE